MSPNEIPLVERVSACYSILSSAANDLNAVSDELGKSVADIDSVLKKLNLGVSVWVGVRSGGGNLDRGDDSFWSEDIGYAKISGKWGISLRTVKGNYTDPDEETVESWLFNDAPRSLRLASINFIPELLETLSKEAVETTKKIQGKLADAQAVSAAVRDAATEPKTSAVNRVAFTVKGAEGTNR